MILKSLLWGCAFASVGFAAQAATFANGGFELGDLSGWSSSGGVVEVVTAADDAIVTPPFGAHYDPVEGDYFAKLTAGEDLGVYTLLSQPFDLLVASSLTGSAAFLAFDYIPYDDDAFVRILSAATNQIVFSSSVSEVGDYGHTSWTHFATGPLAAGAYVLEAGVRDIGDVGGSSQLLVDNFRVAASAVPEPSSWLMMILGMTSVGLALRRGPISRSQRARRLEGDWMPSTRGRI